MIKHPLHEMAMPAGEPDQLLHTSMRWTSMAHSMSHGANHHHAATKRVVGVHWKVRDAHHTMEGVARLHHSAHALADALRDGAYAMESGHHRWTEAHRQWRQGMSYGDEAVREEHEHRSRGEALLSAMTPEEKASSPEVYQRYRAQADGSDGYVSFYRAMSIATGREAITNANHAVRTVSERLHGIASALPALGFKFSLHGTDPNTNYTLDSTRRPSPKPSPKKELPGKSCYEYAAGEAVAGAGYGALTGPEEGPFDAVNAGMGFLSGLAIGGVGCVIANPKAGGIQPLAALAGVGTAAPPPKGGTTGKPKGGKVQSLAALAGM